MRRPAVGCAVSLAAILGLMAFASHARALEIVEFAVMKTDAQADYVTTLVENAAKALRARGQGDEAARTIALFKDNSKAGGVNQLAMNLRVLHSQNDRNSTNPNNRVPVYTVEDAMALTLRDHGITIKAGEITPPEENARPIFSGTIPPPP